MSQNSTTSPSPFGASSYDPCARGLASQGDAYASFDALAARRVLAAQPLGDISTIMSTLPAVISAPSDGANSIIQSAATVAIGGGASGNSENPITCSILGNSSGNISSGVIQTITRQGSTRTSQIGDGVGFQTNAGWFDISLKGNNRPWMVYVTDIVTGIRARIQTNDIGVVFTSANGFNYYAVAFGAYFTATASGNTLTVTSLSPTLQPSQYLINNGAIAAGANLYASGVQGGSIIQPYGTNGTSGTGGTGTYALNTSGSSQPNPTQMVAVTRSPRLIEIYAYGADLPAGFAGVNVPNGDSVSPISLGQPRVGAVGDSYWEASMNNTVLNVRLQLPYWVAAYLGCNNPVINGVGSTGVIANAAATAGGALNNFQTRVSMGDMNNSYVGDFDIILALGSINDNNPTNGGLTMPAGAPQLQAAYQTYIQSVMVAQPNAIIVGIPQEFTTGNPALQPQLLAYEAGFTAAAGGERRMIWLPNTLYEHAKSDTSVIGADAVHPNSVFGCRIIGQSLAKSIVAGIKAAYNL